MQLRNRCDCVIAKPGRRPDARRADSTVLAALGNEGAFPFLSGRQRLSGGFGASTGCGMSARVQGVPGQGKRNAATATPRAAEPISPSRRSPIRRPLLSRRSQIPRPLLSRRSPIRRPLLSRRSRSAAAPEPQKPDKPHHEKHNKHDKHDGHGGSGWGGHGRGHGHGHSHHGDKDD